MAVITVDVDYTVIDLVPIWWRWLEGVTHCEKDIKILDGLESIDYNLSVYFKDELSVVNRDGLDFYRQDGLYDTLKPDPKSIEVLRNLSDAGHEIVFVSSIKGRHSKSKAEFINRNYPFRAGIVYTKEKQFIHSEVFIDDRVDHINKSRAPIKILFDTRSGQYEDLKVPAVKLRSWKGIGEYLYPYFLIGGNSNANRKQ